MRQREIGLVLAAVILGLVAMVCLPSCIESSAKTTIPTSSKTNLIMADEIQNSPDIQTFDPGVHLFPGKDFPQRLAEWIWDHPQTIVVSVCPYADNRFLVITRPDPDRLPDVIPGSSNDIPVPSGRR